MFGEEWHTAESNFLGSQSMWNEESVNRPQEGDSGQPAFVGGTSEHYSPCMSPVNTDQGYFS